MPSKKVKKAQESIGARLQLVMKSGKYTLGYRQALKSLRGGKGAFSDFLPMKGFVLTCVLLFLCLS